MSKNVLKLSLLPRQAAVLNEIINGKAPMIGIGGGRGSAKSSGIDRILLYLMASDAIATCVIMRNYNQIMTFHIDQIVKDFPDFKDNMKRSVPAELKIGSSTCYFMFAESLDDVKRKFMSGNFKYIFIDQSEQFSGEEIREIRRACRTKDGSLAKMILSFNMRGAGLVQHRKWFDVENQELYSGESPDDYKFFKFNPWDNVFWVTEALKEDGYSRKDYYRWTDEQRKAYAAIRGQYTRQLANDDEIIRAADWEGSWTSVEGCYFAESFDVAHTAVSRYLVEQIRKPWSTHWMAQDWGRSHFCSTHWFFRTTISPSEIKEYLGWKIEKPMNVTVTYRELIQAGKESAEIALDLVKNTPEFERNKIKAFFIGADAFKIVDSPKSVAMQESTVMRQYSMPGCLAADNSRVDGYALMGKLLKASKGMGYYYSEGEKIQADDIWLISTDCPELLKSIPLLMRDPKNIDDVLKTDKGGAKIEQDVTDSARYGLKSMLAPKKKTEVDIHAEKIMALADNPAAQTMAHFKYVMNKDKKNRTSCGPSWKSNLKDK